MTKKSSHFTSAPDQGHKKLFSEQAAAGAREPFSGTLDERADQYSAEAQRRKEEDAARNVGPVPSGDDSDIHKDDAAEG